MKYALITDIHSNMAALRVVLEDIPIRFPEYVAAEDFRVFCLGDVVGYGADANEATEAIFNVADKVVPGNHDLYVGDVINGKREVLDELRPAIAKVLLWTVDNLSDENKARIAQLSSDRDYTVKEGSLIFTHSAPEAPEEMEYVRCPTDALVQFFRHEHYANRFCFMGHTHSPQVYGANGTFEDLTPLRFDTPTVEEFDLSKYHEALVVVPSVGQPRDGDCRTGYAMFDSDTQKLSVVRLNYNREPTQEKMEQNDFPSRFIKRLDIGF